MDRTILTVDDDVSVTTYVNAALEPEGFQVMSASSGPQAVAVAQDYTPDLILLDVQMPGLGGYDVLEALRVVDDTGQLPVLKAGVVDYISKSVLHPDRVDVLVYRIKNFFSIQENERLRGALSTMVAANHEINNALMVIQGSADIMRLKGLLGPKGEARELLSRIVNSGCDIARVVDRISHLEKWEATAYTRGVEMLDLSGAEKRGEMVTQDRVAE